MGWLVALTAAAAVLAGAAASQDERDADACRSTLAACVESLERSLLTSESCLVELEVILEVVEREASAPPNVGADEHAQGITSDDAVAAAKGEP